MSVTLGDMLQELAAAKSAAIEMEPGQERQDKARDLIVGMMAFAARFVGADLLQEAYGSVEPGDRHAALRQITMRTHTVSALFASLPIDEGSMTAIAREAWAVLHGDAPSLFAKMPEARKSAYRITKAKFVAILWDAYLEAAGVKLTIRHTAIAEAFGHDWDTVSRWIKPALEKLGGPHVDFMRNKAQVEGRRGDPFSYGVETPYGSEVIEMDWRSCLKQSGQRFLELQRAMANR